MLRKAVAFLLSQPAQVGGGGGKVVRTRVRFVREAGSRKVRNAAGSYGVKALEGRGILREERSVFTDQAARGTQEYRIVVERHAGSA